MPDEDHEHVVEVTGDADKPVEVDVTVKGVRVLITLQKRNDPPGDSPLRTPET